MFFMTSKRAAFFLGSHSCFQGMSFGLPVRKAHRSKEENIHPGYFPTAPCRRKQVRESLEKRRTERNNKHIQPSDAENVTKEPSPCHLLLTLECKTIKISLLYYVQ